MDNFQRMIKSAIARRITYVLVGFVFAFFLHDEAKAENIPYSPTTVYTYSYNNCTIDQILQPSQLLTGSSPAVQTELCALCGGAEANTAFRFCSSPNSYADYSGGASTQNCPIGYTDTGTDCFRPDPPVDCNDPARNLNGAPYGGTGTLPASICVLGCEYPLSSGVSGCKNGNCYFEASVGAPSGACTESSEVTEKTEENRTPEEQCISNQQGYISTNGIVTCVGAGTPGGGDISVSSDPLGTGTTGTVGFTNTGAVDTDGDGQPDITKQDFCKDNPFSPQCNGVFGGNCNQGFSCEGDAVMCAIARKQHQTFCEATQSDAVSELGSDIIQGQSITGNPLTDSETFDLGSLDTTATMSKADLSDMSFSVGGHSLVVPLSSLNDGLRFAGLIVLAFAYVAAARIIFS